MENELIRPIVRIGNSAGVILPRKWLNSQAKVVLEPLNIEKDILDILIKEEILKEIEGVYLVGSYARSEQTIDSDIDVLAITNNLNKIIKKGRYEITCVSKEKTDYLLKNNALPILAWIKEAKTVINENLRISLTNTPLNKKNLKWHIETTKSAMKVMEKSIELSKDMGLKEGDASSYSLVLRLRTFYIIDCIRKNKQWKKKEFLSLIKKISGSLNAYEGYLRVKNDSKEKGRYNLEIKEAEKLMNYINKKIKEIEKWAKEKKD